MWVKPQQCSYYESRLVLCRISSQCKQFEVSFFWTFKCWLTFTCTQCCLHTCMCLMCVNSKAHCTVCCGQVFCCSNNQYNQYHWVETEPMHICIQVLWDMTVQDNLSGTVILMIAVLVPPLNMLCRIIWVYISAGIWVYPLLGHFSTAGLVGFFILNMSVVTLLYLLGDMLNRHVWSKWRLPLETDKWIWLNSHLISLSLFPFIYLLIYFLSVSSLLLSPLSR